MRQGNLAMTEVIILPTGKIRQFNRLIQYLGILEAEGIKNNGMKEKTKREYL